MGFTVVACSQRFVPVLLTMLRTVFVANAVSGVFGQNVGTQKTENHPKLTVQECTKSGGCITQQRAVVIDANWRWTHTTEGATNCYTGNQWSSQYCPDADTCTKNCAIEGADEEYTNTYGVFANGAELTLNFVTQGPYSTNIGSRARRIRTRALVSMDLAARNLTCGRAIRSVQHIRRILAMSLNKPDAMVWLAATMTIHQVDRVAIDLMECVTKMGAIFRRSVWVRSLFMVLVPISHLIPPSLSVSQPNSSLTMVQMLEALLRCVEHFVREMRWWRSLPLMLEASNTAPCRLNTVNLPEISSRTAQIFWRREVLGQLTSALKRVWFWH